MINTVLTKPRPQRGNEKRTIESINEAEESLYDYYFDYFQKETIDIPYRVSCLTFDELSIEVKITSSEDKKRFVMKPIIIAKYSCFIDGGNEAVTIEVKTQDIDTSDFLPLIAENMKLELEYYLEDKYEGD